MKEITVKISAHKFQNLFINHIRYSLTRKNLTTDIAIEDIKTYWLLLESTTRETITRDIQHEIDKNKTLKANKRDTQQWKNALVWIEASRNQTTAKPLNDYLPVVDPKLIEKY